MYSIKVKDAVPLSDGFILVFFEDNKIKKFDVKQIIPDYPEYQELLDSPELFQSLKVEPGGYGISWNSQLDCSEGELYDNGIDIPLTPDDFNSFARHNLVTTKDAAEILKCSKQNIDDLAKRGRLHPIKYNERYSLFLRNEVERRLW